MATLAIATKTPKYRTRRIDPKLGVARELAPMHKPRHDAWIELFENVPGYFVEENPLPAYYKVRLIGITKRRGQCTVWRDMVLTVKQAKDLQQYLSELLSRRVDIIKKRRVAHSGK